MYFMLGKSLKQKILELSYFAPRTPQLFNTDWAGGVCARLDLTRGGGVAVKYQKSSINCDANDQGLTLFKPYSSIGNGGHISGFVEFAQ